MLKRRGEWHGARFSYAHNLVGCTRTVFEDEVFTALYGWGKGLLIEDEEGSLTGGYMRRLSFADVNGGAAYVADDDARALWGRWDASRGERVHSFGDAVFPECKDSDELLALTKAALAESCVPKVSCECDVAVLDGGVPVGARGRGGRGGHLTVFRVTAHRPLRAPRAVDWQPFSGHFLQRLRPAFLNSTGLM